MIRQLFKPSPIESAFLNWIQKGSVSELVVWKKSLSTGYGLAACGRIQRGAELVKIPSPLWKPYSAECNTLALGQGNPALFKSLVELSCRLMPRFPKQAEALVQSACLALTLTKEASSPLEHPYIGMLRQSSYPLEPNCLPHPLLMDQKVYLDPFLQNTACYNDIINRRNMYNYLASVLFGNLPAAEGAVMMDLFKWSIGIILSRGISGEGFPFSLVPVLDFVNHASNGEHNAVHSFDKDSQSFVLTACKDINPSEEITISYGSGRNSESFMSMYGFLPKHKNPNDVVIINISEELMRKKSGESVRSEVLDGLKELNIHNVVSTKRGLTIRHSVMAPVGQLEEVLLKVCAMILGRSEGVILPPRVIEMSHQVMRTHIRATFLHPETLLAFGVKRDKDIIGKTEKDTLVDLEGGLSIVSEGVPSEGGLSYWRQCCATILLRDLRELLPLSGSWT